MYSYWKSWGFFSQLLVRGSALQVLYTHEKCDLFVITTNATLDIKNILSILEFPRNLILYLGVVSLWDLVCVIFTKLFLKSRLHSLFFYLKVFKMEKNGKQLNFSSGAKYFSSILWYWVFVDFIHWILSATDLWVIFRVITGVFHIRHFLRIPN